MPDRLAVDLRDVVDDETGACLGIPGITAHRAVFADGPVSGVAVLVHGALGAMGAIAAQLAPRRRDGDRDRTPDRRPIPIADPHPLEQAAQAHDQVDADNGRRVLLAIPD